MPRRAIAALAVGLTLLSVPAVAPAATSAPQASLTAPVGLQAYYEQHLQWASCDHGLQCASYRVPLDYAKPAGRSITIQVARARATGTSRGPLVLNPGGPGGSGIEYIQDPAYAVSSTARRNFDLIGFDPRGVGASQPLWCLKGTQLDGLLDADPTPETTAEQQDFLAWGKRLAAACEREDAALMAHMSTAEMARDLDILRALLGQQRLRYLGKSWGTALGTVYAALFPQRVGSFVLDGAVNLRLSSQVADYQQGLGFEQATDRFVDWCLAQGRCPLGTTQATAKARLVRFVRDLDRHPLATGDPERPLTEAQAYMAILGPLYVANGGWDWLLQALTPAIEQGKGRPLQAIFDWFVERNSKGVYANNANTAIYVVNCLDGKGAADSPAQAAALQAKWQRTLPFMGAVMAWGDLTCADWPYRAVTDPARLRVRGVPPILVVSATHDPATPMSWGRALAAQLPGAALLTRDGDGHTSYANDDLCIDRAVDAYLLSKDPLHPSLPPKGKRCA